MRRLAYPLVLLATRWMDRTVPVERLHELLRRELDDLQKRPDRAHQAMVQTQTDDLVRARWLAAKIGLLGDAEAVPPPEEDAVPVQRLAQWIAAVPEGKVVTSERLVAGTGWWLDRIESAGLESHCDFVERSLESLLRHVEIRAARCLEPVQPAATADQTWLEKHDVAILLARSARRRKDLRFLNAAMKLNDRAYPAHRRRPVSPRYLLALAEQETAAGELMS